MLIFDIDSLIMLNKSDSEMSKTKSISNIRIYQFIREKCKTSIIEETEPDKEVSIKSYNIENSTMQSIFR
jgi:hypothetical protein